MADSNKEFTEYINILLLGERGIGKSTLINAFANYMRFDTFKEAEEAADIQCLVRTQVIGTTENGEPMILDSMNSNTTTHEVANFQTQEVRAYEIPYNGKVIRLIDTPGITCTKIEDHTSCAKILNFAGQLKHIHGVCVLIKPDLARITSDFMYSLLMYISKLGRTVANNIIFLFTRTRRSNYMALDTITSIRPILEEMASKQKLFIPLRNRKSERKNCFYFENECFNYLVAQAQNVQMNISKICLEESWTVSQNSMRALLEYISGNSQYPPLEPYILPDFENNHRGQTLIFEMMMPLIHVAEIIITNLDQHHINIGNASKKPGKGNTTVDVAQVLLVKDLKISPLEETVATCMTCEIDCSFQDLKEEPTGQSNTMIRIREFCKTCYCESTIHLLRYYKSRKIDTKSEKISKVPYDIYVNEYLYILNCLAYFAAYLSQHVSKKINDVYYKYLCCRIDMEHAAKDNAQQLRCYKALLEAYQEATRKTTSENIHVTPEQIIEYVENLKKLTLTGSKISEMYLYKGRQSYCVPTPMEVDEDVEIPSVPNSKEVARAQSINNSIQVENQTEIDVNIPKKSEISDKHNNDAISELFDDVLKEFTSNNSYASKVNQNHLLQGRNNKDNIKKIIDQPSQSMNNNLSTEQDQYASRTSDNHTSNTSMLEGQSKFENYGLRHSEKNQEKNEEVSQFAKLEEFGRSQYGLKLQTEAPYGHTPSRSYDTRPASKYHNEENMRTVSQSPQTIKNHMSTEQDQYRSRTSDSHLQVANFGASSSSSLGSESKIEKFRLSHSEMNLNRNDISQFEKFEEYRPNQYVQKPLPKTLYSRPSPRSYDTTHSEEKKYSNDSGHSSKIISTPALMPPSQIYSKIYTPTSPSYAEMVQAKGVERVHAAKPQQPQPQQEQLCQRPPNTYTKKSKRKDFLTNLFKNLFN